MRIGYAIAKALLKSWGSNLFSVKSELMQIRKYQLLYSQSVLNRRNIWTKDYPTFGINKICNPKNIFLFSYSSEIFKSLKIKTNFDLPENCTSLNKKSKISKTYLFARHTDRCTHFDDTIFDHYTHNNGVTTVEDELWQYLKLRGKWKIN